ncbi:phage tail protein [Flavivirga rizhaonensis]|uniref:Phage tail protein n=2 Tax=Flavivirga rizhaonensis TaxID=2559571 RepID=A0A4S1DSI3_9FLAO|nr:phage tail protein [Flavivirga rizhaonensis]
MKTKLSILVLFFVLSINGTLHAQEPILGEIRMFAGDFAPRGWAFCDGQTLQISQYNALFSLLGTNYGGDGRSTFNLPDLRGRAPIHAGQGNNLNNIRLGDKGGSESKELRKMTVFENAKGKSYETYTVKSSNSKLYTRDPYLGVRFIIALQGIFPSRSY